MSDFEHKYLYSFRYSVVSNNYIMFILYVYEGIIKHWLFRKVHWIHLYY